MEGGLHEKPNDTCARMCRRYVGSASYRYVLLKIREKLQIKTTGGCNNSLGCSRVIEIERRERERKKASER